jgi:hypothetical protein
MVDGMAARCGIYCGECEYRGLMNCPGCLGAQGKPFWGECLVAACNIGKGLRHCGECHEFPCQLLNRFAYDPKQGDDGQRIRNLRAWKVLGYATWLASREAGGGADVTREEP